MEIKIPAPITIAGKPYGQPEMVRYIIRHDLRFNRDADGARIAREIDDAYRAAGTSGTVSLSEVAGKLLSEVVKKPSCGWIDLRSRARDENGKVTIQRLHVPAMELLPLIEPILGA